MFERHGEVIKARTRVGQNVRQLDHPQEIMDLAVKLGMEPFTLQEATEAAERHARIIARRLMTTGKQKAEKSTL